jgi:hypothetical protein
VRQYCGHALPEGLKKNQQLGADRRREGGREGVGRESEDMLGRDVWNHNKYDRGRHSEYFRLIFNSLSLPPSFLLPSSPPPSLPP